MSGNRGKSQKRPECELFKKVNEIEKKMVKIDPILEILKKNNVNLKFVEEEIVVDDKFISESKGLQMIVDSGAPLSIVSKVKEVKEIHCGESSD